MIAIDFETANYDPASACSVGFAFEKAGRIETCAFLIRPPKLVFEPRFIQIHGINPQMVAKCPTFAELWEQISWLIVGQQLCAHNASFDRGVLNALIQHYHIPVAKKYSFSCTVRLARQSFPQLPNHRLPTVAGHLGIPLKHHDAASDAEACLRIALSCKGACRTPAHR